MVQSTKVRSHMAQPLVKNTARGKSEARADIPTSIHLKYLGKSEVFSLTSCKYGAWLCLHGVPFQLADFIGFKGVLVPILSLLTWRLATQPRFYKHGALTMLKGCNHLLRVSMVVHPQKHMRGSRRESVQEPLES